MLSFLKDPLLDDVVSRAEQSRFSYTLQTEEFRNLNSNLQTYLNEIKIIDDENRQLQENIEQIRTNYIITLENHLKGLPEDFRQESSILTEAHIERYKSKSRAKRFINEREELKKRIHFAVSNEKDQIKRLNNLQKQERLVNNEFKNLNAQIQNLYNCVQTEKQTHQQAMDKVDNLQIQLEQICIERSKTEFEIQTLREEVKLMQTTKEFLDEERETILSTQTEANEYLLSRLNDSISRIREDFNALNKTQLKQIENEYKQMIKILEENSLTNGTIDETTINHQRAIQISYEKLQDEHQSITQELTILNDHNQVLSEKILNMETDLYSIRDERIRELIAKDNEFERSQIELQTLNEKLNHLAEYDKNLKFELTLYRGVLESEYRRKQQQIINNQQLIRPATLRSNRNSSKVLTNRNQLEPIGEKVYIQIDDMKIEIKDELDRQDGNAVTQEQHQIQIETPKSPISTVPVDQLSSSEVQQSPTTSPTNQETSLASGAPPPDLITSLEDYQITPETSNLSVSPIDSTLPEDQLASPDIHYSPVGSSGIQDLSESSPTTEEAPLASAPPILLEDHQKPIGTQKLSSIPPSTDSEIPPEAQESPTTPAVSEVRQLSSTELKGQQDSSEAQELSAISPNEEQIPRETEKTSISPINTTPPIDLSPSTLSDNHQMASDVQQSSNISSNEQSTLPEPFNTPSQEDRSTTSDMQSSASTPSQDQPTSSEIQQSPITDENVQERPSSETVDEHQTTTNLTTGKVNSTNQLADVSGDHDNLTEYQEKRNSVTHETDDVANDLYQPTQSIEPSTAQDDETNQSDKQNIKSSEQDQPTTMIEEQISSSDQNQLEKDIEIGYISSTGYYGTINDSSHVIYQELNKQSLTDAEQDNIDLIGEVGSTSSPKLDDNNESNLRSVLQDLRYVYRSLINNDDLVEINDDFPDNLIDRLEFGDNLIRTLFDGFLRKYLVQPAKIETRSKTLDWIEFRDILFPIVTIRYMEVHIRKLFDLFDINKTGYLSLQEITELLELLQVNNPTELAEYLTNQKDKLNIDELIEGIKQADDTNNNILSDEMENKSWYIQRPTEEENIDTQSISLEIPNVDIPPEISSRIILLSRIFRRVGADFENKQLDSTKPTLSMKITNEFIHNNIHISSDDLQSFIELYLNKKQNSDCSFINWIEFRDIFFPIVNSGMVSKDDITRWFEILDTNHNNTISQEQILHLLHLLQVTNSEDILNKIPGLCTLEELIFALENLNETKIHLLSTNDQTNSFDLDWLTKNIF